MKKRNQGIYRMVWSLSMSVLLCLAAFVPIVGGFLQQHHRAIRQRVLSAGQTKETPVRIVLENSILPHCFFPKDKELVFNGLRYDVLSFYQEGNSTVFKAIPDIKETQICTATLRSIQFPQSETVSTISFTPLDYLPNPEILPHLPQFSKIVRSVFWEESAGVLEGFEWMFAPPPDRVYFTEKAAKATEDRF